MVTCPETTLLYNKGVNTSGPGRLFAGLTPQQLIEVEEIGQALSFDKGEAVFHEGDPWRLHVYRLARQRQHHQEHWF